MSMRNKDDVARLREMCKVKLYATLTAVLFIIFTNGCKSLSTPDGKSTSPSDTTQPGDYAGCALRFEGEDRKVVKLRAPRYLNYRALNAGRPLSVAQWFAYVCTFDEEVPTERRDVPQDRALEMENNLVVLRAYILAVRREDDNDFHVQVGDDMRWDQEQIIVEVPPGATYCDARNVITDLMLADGARGNEKTYIFRQPPQATMTGLVFLDSAHIPGNLVRSDYCRFNGNRGIKNGLLASPVRGLWEIHPVFKVETKAGTTLPAGSGTRSAPRPAASPAPSTTTGQIIGNKNSRVYHRPDCPGYNKVLEKNRVYFNSEAEAQKADFRQARNCP
jgi:hypothetical protein